MLIIGVGIMVWGVCMGLIYENYILAEQVITLKYDYELLNLNYNSLREVNYNLNNLLYVLYEKDMLLNNYKNTILLSQDDNILPMKNELITLYNKSNIIKD